MAVEFELLGHVDAHVDGAPIDLGHARQRCVLAALLVDANRPVPVDVLLDRVWGERLPQRARNALAGYVSRLRGLLTDVDDVALGRHAEGYQLSVDEDAVDLHRFHRLVAEARGVDDDRAAADLLNAALGQWRGEAFAALDTPWLAAVRASLDAEWLAATLDRNDIALRLGRHTDLLGELAKLADEHPLDERLAAQLMLALYRCGRQADALRHYEAVRVRLAEGLGADPGPDLRELHQMMLRADPALVAPKLAASDSVPVPRQLPPPSAAFVGRAREVAELDTALADQDAASGHDAPLVIHAISGMPGVGKTTLALHWAHRVAHGFADGQLYVNLRGFDPGGAATTPAEALQLLLDSLGVPPRRIPATVEARSALYRTLLAGRQILVVLDNARDADQVRPLLPGASGCTVLVTSRAALGGLVMAEGARPMTLNVLSQAESRDLLGARLGAKVVDADPTAAADIVARCGGLPLAVAIVAARVATNTGLTLEQVAAELKDTADPLEVLADAEPATNVRTVFSWSYAALTPAAGRLFRRLGLHPGPDIGLPAVASLDGAPVKSVRAAMAELARAHLVTRVAADRFALHDLLRVYAADLGLAEGDIAARRAATTRMLDHYLHTGYAAAVALHPHRHRISLPPPVEGSHIGAFVGLEPALAWFRAEHEVLLGVASLAHREEFHRHVWQLVWTLTDYLDRHGRWQQQLALQNAALAAARGLDDTEAQAACHRAIGRVWGTLGRHDEAHRHLVQALGLYTVLGDRAALGHTHLGLSWVLEHQGKVAEAIEHDERALELFRDLDHVLGQARSLNHLGLHRLQAGDHRRAVEDCAIALELFRQVGDRFGEASANESLGQANHRLGRYDRAVASYERALALLRALGDRYYEAQTTSHIGDAHRDSGRPEQARGAWLRSLSILEELKHPEAAGVRAKLTG